MAALDQIINSITRGQEAVSGSSLIISNHLTQCKLFGIRQGIEILPQQDDEYDSRKKFIDNLWKQNKLDLYQESIWDYLMCDGEVLLYLRPNNQNSYTITFYNKDEYKAYYDESGDLIKCCIRYQYEVENNIGLSANNVRWVKLEITSQELKVGYYDTQPSFNGEYLSTGKSETFENTLNFIPCVVCKNKPSKPGAPGRGEFDSLKTQIEGHENNVSAISSNLEFFGAPSLVSTRSPSELTEAIEFGSENLNKHRTVTSANGWYSPGFQRSTKNADPFNYRMGNGSGVRIKRIVGNVSPEERFGYIAPDPVSPDHVMHVREEREALHFALGGIDERGISANATAYELKSIYGKVAATAIKKCRAIYDYGFCKLFEMALAAEEDTFRKSIAYRLNKKIEEITDDFIGKLISESKLPQGVFGLPPIGSRECRWRWKGPVFERSPRDMQLISIVARNLQELGVRSMEALKVLFEDKTDKELEQMLAGGYPFRYMSSVGSTTSQMIGLYQQLLSVPAQSNPNLPMGSQIPIQPLINRSIETLYKELNYQPDYDPVKPGDVPEYNTGYQRYYDATTGIVSGTGERSNATDVQPTTASGSTVPGGYPTSPLASAGIVGRHYTGEPVGSGIQQSSIPPEFTARIPESGTTVTKSPAPTIQQEQSVLGGGIPPTATGIPADLAVTAAQPGSVWQQLFPNFSRILQPKSKRSSKRSK